MPIRYYLKFIGLKQINQSFCEVGVVVGIGGAQSVILPVRHATLDELLGCLRHFMPLGGVRGEIHLVGFQDYVLIEDVTLAHALPEGFFAVEEFEEDNSKRPYINFGGYFGVKLLKGLGREVPVGPNTLGGQIHPCIFFVHDLAESEIEDLHNTVSKHNVVGFQVVVDDSFLPGGEVFNS